jgi:hypothetical protein
MMLVVAAVVLPLVSGAIGTVMAPLMIVRYVKQVTKRYTQAVQL